MNHGSKKDTIEVFDFIAIKYNVSKAKTLVEGREADGEICPRDWQEFFSREISCGESRRMLTMGIRVNHDHVPTVDLADPVIIAHFELPGEDEPVPIPIDGWHRIQKAINEDVETLPAYVLDLKDSNKVRIR
jgi:hypothetical protein